MPIGDELKKVMKSYKLLGYHSAIGSIDPTHVKWNKCLVLKQNFCIEKKKHATVSFQYIVDPLDKRVTTVSDIVRNVSQTQDVKW